MILYNTLMGFCAGLILLRVARMVADQYEIDREDGVVLVVLGLPLTVLSGAMALTWPLTVNPPINIAFSEPALMLGLLALVTGVVILRSGVILHLNETGPLNRVIGALGLMMFAISMAIFRFDLVGDAPAIEPITGQFSGWENTTFGLVYLVVAIGCFATWFITYDVARIVAVWAWRISGVFLLLFSVLNYYTHIGLLVCSGTGQCHDF